MNLPTAQPEENTKKPLRYAIQHEWILRVLIVSGALYLLLCTYLWNILYGLFFVWVTNNAPNAAAAASPWCKPGDWVLETFQPMVSDQRMIEHFNRNKEAMTRVAEMAARGKAADNNGKKAEFKALERDADVEVGSAHPWAEQPYSLENAQASRACWMKAVSQSDRDACWRNDVNLGRGISSVVLRPKFGRTHAQYFCST